MLLDDLLLFLRQQTFFNRPAHCLQRKYAFGTAVVNLDDVESKRGAEDRTDVTGLEGKSDGFELCHHLAAREISQIPTTSRAIGKLIRKALELPATLKGAANFFNGVSCRILVVLLVHVLDDMRRMNGLWRVEAIAVLPVVLHHILSLRSRDVSSHRGLIAGHAQPQLDFPAHIVTAGQTERAHFLIDRFRWDGRGVP